MSQLAASDAIVRGMRAIGLNGSPRHHASSRKYSVGASAVEVEIPTRDGRRPNYIRVHTAGVVYGDFNGVAAVPTTSADGAERLDNGDVIALWTQGRLSLIAEGATTVTLSYVWTTL